jgi:hypothetical protein
MVQNPVADRAGRAVTWATRPAERTLKTAARALRSVRGQVWAAGFRQDVAMMFSPLR